MSLRRNRSWRRLELQEELAEQIGQRQAFACRQHGQQPFLVGQVGGRHAVEQSLTGARKPDERAGRACQAPKSTVAELIEQMGYAPVDLGGVQTCAAMEAPRRGGAVYGEEYRPADADAVVAAVRDGQPLPPTPAYD